MGDDEGWTLQLGNQVRDGEGLARTSDAEEGLVTISFRDLVSVPDLVRISFRDLVFVPGLVTFL